MKTRYIKIIYAVLLCLATFSFFLGGGKSVFAQNTNVTILSYVSLGDSIAAGYGLDGYNQSKQLDGSYFVNNSYAKLLSDYLTENYSLTNANSLGVTGDTVEDLIDLLNENQDVILAVQNAELVTICIGANDILGPSTSAMKMQATSALLHNEITFDFNEIEAEMSDGLQALITNFPTLLNKLTTLNSTAKFVFLDVYNPFYNFMDENIAHDIVISVPYLGNKTISKATAMQVGQTANTFIAGGTDLSGNSVTGLNEILYNEIYRTNLGQRTYPNMYLVGADGQAYSSLNGIYKAFQTYDGDYSDLINATALNYDATNPFVMSSMDEIVGLVDPHPTVVGHNEIYKRIKSYLEDVVYQEQVEETFTVTFDANGGEEIEPIEVQNNQPISQPQTTRANYRLARWEYIGQDGNTYIWNFSEDVVTSDITLKAIWERCYIVEFDSNGGTPVESIEVVTGSKIQMPENVTKNGYKLMCWQYNDAISGDTKTWDFENDLVNTDLTLLAVWKQLFIVNFNTDGGSALESVQVADGEKIDEPQDVIKTGCVLIGWIISGDEQNNYWNFGEDVVETNITLKAVWTSIVCLNVEDDNQLLTIDVEINGFVPIRFELTVPTDSMQWYVGTQAQEGETSSTFEFNPPSLTGVYEIFCVVNGVSTGKYPVTIGYGEPTSITINKQIIYTNNVIEFVVEHPELYNGNLVQWFKIETNEKGEEKTVPIGTGNKIEHKFEKSCKVYAIYAQQNQINSDILDIAIESRIDPSIPVFIGIAVAVFVGITVLAILSRRRYVKY